MATQVVDAAPAPVPARPWRTIWLAPRRTMRELLAAEVRPGFKIVVALAALHAALAILGGLAAKLQIVTLAEVQRFSIGRSLAAFLVWVIPAVLLSALA